MLSLAVFLLAVATASWPLRPAPWRLRRLRGGSPGRRPRRWPVRSGPMLSVAALVLVSFVLSGLGTAVAVFVVTATYAHRRRVARQTRNRLVATQATARMLHGLVAELRAGSHPATAAQRTASDVSGAPATLLRSVASAARLGGDVGGLLRRGVPEAPELVSALRPVATAWSLAGRHGLPLADVLDSVRRDITGRLRFASQVHARMAGPKASGAVLTALPCLGVLLGELMGADPVHVLLATDAGQALLALGMMLVCTGSLWTAKLTNKAVSW